MSADTDLLLGVYSDTAAQPVEPGERRIKLVDIYPIATKPEFYNYDEQGNVTNEHRWEWLWEILGGADKGANFKTRTNTTINKGSAAQPVVEALLGRALQRGEQLSKSAIVNGVIDCYVSDQGPKGGKGNYIVNPRPASAARGAPSPAPQRATVPQVAIPQVNGPLTALAEELEGDEPDPVEARGFPRRRMNALKECQGMEFWTEEFGERWREQIHGAERAAVPFPKMTTREQWVEVRALEAWASGEEVPF